MFGYTYADLDVEKTSILKTFDEKYRWSLQSNDLKGPPKGMEPVPADQSQCFGVKQSLVAKTTSFMAATQEQIMGFAADEDSGATLPDLVVPEATELLEKAPDHSAPVVQWYVDSQVDR